VPSAVRISTDNRIRERFDIWQRCLEASTELLEHALDVDSSWLPSIPCSQRKRQTHDDGSDDDSQHERDRIESALAQSRGRISGPREAAARLGLPSSTLHSLIKKLKIRKNHFKLG
jgi:transcriptional regulator with GAF, ATPase, and Fis domain